MGRKDRYETNVKPKLKEIKEWIQIMYEKDIAKRLGVSLSSFENYKKKYPDLKAAIEDGKETLIQDLKMSLKKKAKGFYYTETRRTYITNENGEKTGEIMVIETKKYAPPDVGAAHLLLKNLDKNWRNDDAATMELKRKQVDLTQKKIEKDMW